MMETKVVWFIWAVMDPHTSTSLLLKLFGHIYSCLEANNSLQRIARSPMTACSRKHRYTTFLALHNHAHPDVAALCGWWTSVSSGLAITAPVVSRLPPMLESKCPKLLWLGSLTRDTFSPRRIWTRSPSPTVSLLSLHTLLCGPLY